MKIFVTGATGFLGRRLVEALVAADHEVTVLVRDEGRAPRGTTPATGTLEGVDGWEHLLSGHEAVVHLAGIVATWAPWRDFSTVVVGGTRDLIAAAERQGVRRFVHISTEAVMQGGKPLLGVDESLALPRRPSSSYGYAKLLAERAVQERSGAIETIILRPTFIWGPGSQNLATLADRAKKKALPLFDRGRADFEHVHVDNVVAAILLSLTGGRPGGVYLVTNGEPMPVRQFLEGVLGAYGAPLPRLSVPSGLLYGVARASEGLWRTLRLSGRPPVTRFEVEFLALPRRYDITLARQELGYRPAITYREAVADLSRSLAP